MKKSFTIVFLVIFITAFSLRTSPAAASEEDILNLAYGSTSLSTIDSALVMDNSQLVDEMQVGFLIQSEIDGELKPGMMTSQSVSADGRTYTFTLRDDVPWVRYNAETDQVERVLDCEGNIRMVTAHDFAYAIKRALEPETASDYAFILHFLENGEAYNTADPGTVDFDTVGVKVIDDFTIEFTFRDAGVYNINIISMWVTYAQPSWIIEGDACTEGQFDRWTEAEFFQGYGPFTLKEWIHDDSISLIKNPFWPGVEAAPVAKIAGVHIKLLDQSAEMAEYEAGTIDTADVPASELDRVKADPILSQEFQLQPGSIGTEFLIVNTQIEPTNDIRVRKALAMALDREAIVETMKTGIPTQIFIHPALSGAPTVEKYPDLGVEYDPEGAKALIDEYCAEKGIDPAELELSLIYPTREDLKMQTEALQYMWKQTLGIEVELKNLEWVSFLNERKESRENLYRASWTNDYKDANNFSADVFVCGATIQKIGDWPSEDCTDVSDPLYQAYAKAVLDAGLEQDPAARAALYAEAEAILSEDVVLIIPIYYYTDEILYKPYIDAPVSTMGNDRWEKWTIR